MQEEYIKIDNFSFSLDLFYEGLRTIDSEGWSDFHFV